MRPAAPPQHRPPPGGRPSEIPQDVALTMWLKMCAGAEPAGGLLEIRHKPHGSHLRRLGFYPVENMSAMVAAIGKAAAGGDVWVGVAPRRGVYRVRDRKRSGGLDAISRVWAMWVDADTSAACDAVRSFEPAPSILIRSGSGLHAYWPLRRPLTPGDAKRACRRLAHHLGADMVATDAARVMRPPGTSNWKTAPPKPVACERLEAVSYSAKDVVGQLTDPPGAVPRRIDRPRGGGGSAVIDGLLRKVADAPIGTRNASLFWAASRVVEHVLRGEFVEAPALNQLRRAAMEAGLDEQEIEQTIGSALARGSVAA
jgi:RepB DNA-primase from phage plasmid